MTKHTPGLEWLPAHKCGLSLLHNEHKAFYESVSGYHIPGYFVSNEEWVKAQEANTVWEVQWYPQTPVHFERVAASSLEALELYFASRRGVQND